MCISWQMGTVVFYIIASQCGLVAYNKSLRWHPSSCSLFCDVDCIAFVVAVIQQMALVNINFTLCLCSALPHVVAVGSGIHQTAPATTTTPAASSIPTTVASSQTQAKAQATSQVQQA